MTNRSSFVTVLAGAVMAAAPVIAHHCSPPSSMRVKNKATGSASSRNSSGRTRTPGSASTSRSVKTGGFREEQDVEVCQRQWRAADRLGGSSWQVQNGLMRLGWSRNSLKNGEVVTVDGTRAKD